MTYRRPNGESFFSSRWRIAHRSELAEFGIPSDVVASDRRWTYVLLHGDDPQSGWNISWLSDQQARLLLDFLTREIPDSTGIWLVQELQRRATRTNRD